MDGHFVFGLVCSAICVGYFFAKGRKSDPVSWIGLIIGIVLIMGVTTHWDEVVTPASHATSQGAPLVSAKAVAPAHTPVVHATPVTYPIAKPTAVHPTSAPSTAPASNVAASVGTAISYAVGVAFLVVILFLVVVLSMVASRRRPVRSKILDQPMCPQCHQQGYLRDYRYRNGRARVTGKLCNDCAGRMNATLA